MTTLLVVISSPPGHPDVARGIEAAKERAADIVLLGEASPLAVKGRIEGFCGMLYALSEDLAVRVHGAALEKGLRVLTAQELESFVRGDVEIVGRF